jgi:oligopeptide transport system permease protein
MLCLGTLVAICLLAFFTPLLPLQPPDFVRTELKYLPPQFSPLWEKSFQLDLEAIRDTPRTADENQLQRSYRDAGFPVVNALSRSMVRARYHLFGEWSLASICGRDELGRDVLARVFWGARISLIVGLVAAGVSLVIGVTYGAVAGYVGGFVDNLMMRIVDVLYSVPFIFVVIFLLTILSQEDVKLWLEIHGIDRIAIFFVVVGAIYWLTMARVVRGQVISLKTEPFVEAARAIGVSQTRIIARHIFPNLLSVVIVYLTLTIPRVMLFEAFLSFLGLGVEPPDVSWGLLANEGIRVITPVRIYWWLILFPSLALGTTLFALNFLGDRLRDAFDPKLAGR